MTGYNYKAVMQNPECGAKRFVTFHGKEYLTFAQIENEATTHMFSQTCPRCNKNHENEEFCLAELLQ